MSEPLHLPTEPEDRLEQLRLGEQTLELDPAAAAAVRSYIENLSGQYQASLEQYRAQTLQNIGTQRYQQAPVPEQPQNLDVPDPDLLFSNKQAWTEEFARNLQSQLGNVRGETAQMAQGILSTVQQELQRRDLAQAAQAKHDSAMEEMLERRGLAEHTRVVQAIYNEQYDKLKHLPLELGLDKIGQLAEDEIARIRHGEKWTMERGPTQQVSQRPPPVLRSARKASAAPPPPAAPPGGLEPGGGLGMMGKIIRERQAKLLNTA